MTSYNETEPGLRVPLYLTAEHSCLYQLDRQAQTLFLDPLAPMDSHLYQQLIDQGFRRSGIHCYRPACPGCRDCVSLRIPVEAFHPNRSQRRNLAHNQRQLQVIVRPAQFDPEHYALYERYIHARHPEGNMADTSPQSYDQFLVEPWGGQSLFFEFRFGRQLLAVAVTDILLRGLSAVYTFFDPARTDFGPGVFAILWQIAEARRRALPFLYLGYWITECPKMTYKERFRPIEAWSGNVWKRFERGEVIALHPVQLPFLG